MFLPYLLRLCRSRPGQLPHSRRFRSSVAVNVPPLPSQTLPESSRATAAQSTVQELGGVTLMLPMAPLARTSPHLLGSPTTPGPMRLAPHQPLEPTSAPQLSPQFPPQSPSPPP